MAQPTKYTKNVDYAAYQSANPGIIYSGTSLDSEFDEIETNLSEVGDNLALIQADDGSLKNGLVTLDKLTSDLAASIASWVPKGAWATGTDYVVDDYVTETTSQYVSLVDHTSGTFATDLAADKWQLVGDAATIAAPTAYAETLLDDATAAAARTTLELGTAATSASTDFIASTANTVLAKHLATSSLGPLLGIINGVLVQSRTGNAETIALKTLAGTDPTAADPIYAVFRDQSLLTGGYVARTISSALSLTLSSGSTMGATNNVAFRLWFVLLDNAGSLEIGAINCIGGAGSGDTSIFNLNPSKTLSTTAEGGAGAADSATIVYSTSAITSKPFIVIGYGEWSSGLAAVGTWDTAPTHIQPMTPTLPLPGTEIGNIISAQSSAGSTTSSTTYVDVTNGDLDITPKSKCNAIAVLFTYTAQTGYSSGGTTPHNITRIVRDSTTIGPELVSYISVSGVTDVSFQMGRAFTYLDLPYSVSSLTYKIQHKASIATTSATTDAICKKLSEIQG